MTSPIYPSDRFQQRTARLAEIARKLDAQRHRTEEFLGTHKRLLADVERRFAGEFEIITSRISDWEEFQDEFSRRFDAFRDQQRAVEQDRAALETRAAELARLASATEEQRARLAKKLDERRRRLVAEQQEMRESRDSDLTAAQESLRKMQEELELSRQRAQELEAKQRNSDRQLKAFEVQLQEAREQLERSQGQLGMMAQDQAATADSAEQDALRAELETVRGQYELAVASADALREKQDRLTEELETLQALLAERELSRTGNYAPEEPEEQDFSDWEAQKRRLLANLEGGLYSDEESDRVEQLIRRTDELLAQKDQQMTELMQQLQLERNRREASASTAESARVEEILDADAIIRQEREKLQELQKEWHDKLRAAEVECAKERAQNARLRSELESKLRDVSKELERSAAQDGSKTKSGRRWLDHLGLTPNDNNG